MQQNIGRKIIKKRRVFSCLLMIMMIFNMLGSTSGYQVFAADDGYRFRSIEVTVDGTKLEDYSEKIVQDATVKLRCEWEVDNNVKLAGGEQLVWIYRIYLILGLMICLAIYRDQTETTGRGIGCF